MTAMDIKSIRRLGLLQKGAKRERLETTPRGPPGRVRGVCGCGIVSEAMLGVVVVCVRIDGFR